jgi:tetrahydromethanopterin S-methyltransferase subunit F
VASLVEPGGKNGVRKKEKGTGYFLGLLRERPRLRSVDDSREMPFRKAGILPRGNKKVSGTISRRVAGIWFIGFLRSVSFVWFDERERQDRPARQIADLGLLRRIGKKT